MTGAAPGTFGSPGMSACGALRTTRAGGYRNQSFPAFLAQHVDRSSKRVGCELGESMFHVTLRARAELHEMLTRVLAQRSESQPELLSFRLLPGADDESGLALTLDTSRRSDQVVRHDGRAVLLYAPDTVETLDSLTLDIVETREGVGFQLRR